jgi:septum site-determining protein MinD
MSNLGQILEIDHQPRLHHVLAGEAEVSQAITEGPGGVSILAGHESLEAFAHGEPSNLRPVIHGLEKSFDTVIVDTGAGVARETFIPAGASDGVILVTSPNEVSIVDARRMVSLADRVGTDVVGAVITKADADTEVASVSDKLGEEVLAVVPRDQTAVREEPLVLNAEESYAAQAYRQLAVKLLDVAETAVEQPTHS